MKRKILLHGILFIFFSLIFITIGLPADPVGTNAFATTAFLENPLFAGERQNIPQAPFHTGETMLGFLNFLGGKPKDTDLDGVNDKIDECPATPAGAQVDSRGCSIDSDRDGVPDGIDICPGTPAVAWVNDKGCPRDSDHDGVFDGLDACPDSPPGIQADSRGCPLDSDGDGVPNGLDRCSDTPPGIQIDSRGCPIDSDGDGVPDVLDQCRGTPKGVIVNASGCPDVLLNTPEGDVAVLSISFVKGSREILPQSYTKLNEVALSIRTHPGMEVQINGHTDSSGTARFNRQLSQERAEAVMAYLVFHGVSPSQLVAKGYGESRPLASNKTPQGRSKNRRIEFKILKK